MRWGAVGYGLVALAPQRAESGWTDVVLLAVCVFMTTLRTMMPLALGDHRRWPATVPLIDVAVFSVAVGWTGATESPWLLCLLTAVAVAAFGWGPSTALTSGAVSVAIVTVFFEVSGADLTSIVAETNDLFAVISVAVTAAGGVFLRNRLLDAARKSRAAGGELARLRAANDLLGELSDVALTLPGAFTLREALDRTRTLLTTYMQPWVIALLTLDEHNDDPGDCDRGDRLATEYNAENDRDDRYQICRGRHAGGADPPGQSRSQRTNNAGPNNAEDRDGNYCACREFGLVDRHGCNREQDKT